MRADRRGNPAGSLLRAFQGGLQFSCRDRSAAATSSRLYHFRDTAGSGFPCPEPALPPEQHQVPSLHPGAAASPEAGSKEPGRGEASLAHRLEAAAGTRRPAGSAFAEMPPPLAA